MQWNEAGKIKINRVGIVKTHRSKEGVEVGAAREAELELAPRD